MNLHVVGIACFVDVGLEVLLIGLRKFLSNITDNLCLGGKDACGGFQVAEPGGMFNVIVRVFL